MGRNWHLAPCNFQHQTETAKVAPKVAKLGAKLGPLAARRASLLGPRECLSSEDSLPAAGQAKKAAPLLGQARLLGTVETVALQRPRCANSNRLQLSQSPNAKLATCQVWPQASLVQFWQLQKFERLEQLSLEFSTARLAWTSIVDKLAAWTNWASSGAHLGAQICLLANQQAPHRHSCVRGSAQLALVAASCRAVDGQAQVHLGAHLRAFASAGFALYLHVNARTQVGQKLAAHFCLLASFALGQTTRRTVDAARTLALKQPPVNNNCHSLNIHPNGQASFPREEAPSCIAHQW